MSVLIAAEALLRTIDTELYFDDCYIKVELEALRLAVRTERAKEVAIEPEVKS